MPDNYSITTFNFTEEILAAMYAGNMLEGGTMTITPDQGYVVSASDFSHDTLPEAVATCVFTDTGTAGQLGNTVLVTFTFQNLFTITSSLPPIYIHIIGDAQVYVEDDRTVDFSIDFIDNTVKNLNGFSVVDKIGSAITVSPSSPPPSPVNGVETTTLSATGIASGMSGQIGTLKVEADAGFNFANPPTIRLENMPEGTVTLQLNTVTRRDGEVNVYIWNYKIMFISEIDISSLSGAKVFIEYKGIAAINRTSSKEILKILYGEPTVSANGETRIIKIVGEVGAEFDLTLTKNSNNTSILDESIVNANVLHIPGGLILGINKTLTSSETDVTIAEYEFIQVFPAASSEIYHVNVTPKNGTILNSNLPQTAPQGIIYQYANPTITLDTDAGTNYGVTTKTSIAYTGRPNKTPSRLRHIKSINETFSFTYVYTRTGGHTFTTADLPVWDSSDLSETTTTSDWIENVSDHGNEIEIFNIAIALTSGNTIATVTGNAIIKKFGTASVTLNLDSSRFLTSS